MSEKPDPVNSDTPRAACAGKVIAFRYRKRAGDGDKPATGAAAASAEWRKAA